MLRQALCASLSKDLSSANKRQLWGSKPRYGGAAWPADTWTSSIDTPGPNLPFTGSPDAAARPVEPAIRFTHTIGDRGKAKMSCLPAPQPLLSDIRRSSGITDLAGKRAVVHCDEIESTERIAEHE